MQVALNLGVSFDSDALNLLILLLGVLVVFVLGRWASRFGEANPLPTYQDVTAPSLTAVSSSRQADPKVAARRFPPDSRLGSILITNFYFTKFDAASGPPDPKVFCDELFVELYDADSGYSWTQSFAVATPEGLAQVLNEQSWTYLHAGSMLVFARYDLEKVRQAVIDRIVEDHEVRLPDETPKPEWL